MSSIGTIMSISMSLTGVNSAIGEPDSSTVNAFEIPATDFGLL